MSLLFVCMAFVAFCYLKEVYVLFDGLKDNFYIAGLSFAINLAGIPLIASFFAEVVSPGLATRRRVLCQFLAQAAFIPIFAIFPTRTVLSIALWCAYGAMSLSLVFGCFLLMRHRKYIRDNYSYTEHVDVNWALNFAVVMVVCSVVYIAVVTNVTWMSRTIFNLLLMFAWIYLNRLARNHSVVEIPPMVMFAFPLIKHDNVEVESVEEPAPTSDIYRIIAEHLDKCMVEKKLFLNPKLTLQDVSSAIGTNRTYLSDYLNKVLKTTFYEYVNDFRIRRACEIIDSMTEEKKRSMQEISELSGFNSISTFNRSFAKIVGVTPSQYLAKKQK